MRAILFLYRLAQILGFPLIVLYFLSRGFRDRRYFGRFAERLGYVPKGLPGGVWLHAVSVGEVIAAAEIARRLRVEMPGVPVYVSTTTLAGRTVAEQKFPGLADGIFFAPIDFCFAVRRVLRALRPRVVVVLETEIWPNVFRESKRAGCRLVVVNARLSDRAWPRYQRFRWFFRYVLQLPDAILSQNDLSRERFAALGAPTHRTRTAGNLKYDFDPRRARVADVVERFFEETRAGEVLIAASTMPPAEPGDPDEDDVVIDAFQKLAPNHPRLLLVLVPRKPERFDAAADRLARAGVRFVRRSSPGRLELPGVLLLDSIGELSGLFRFAHLVFMGGTLPHRGGHNILEPAFFGAPVIVGPHMENFPDIAAKFAAGGGTVRIENAAELADAVDGLLCDPAQRAAIGERARQLAEAEQGAAGRAVAEIRKQMGEAVPRRIVPFPARAAMWPLSRLWLAGSGVERRLARRRRLKTPVVSVGGIAAGGAGKSPLVLWLAGRLDRPAILTRGYRRASGERCTVLETGAAAPSSVTGDEAQAYLRARVGPVGISADRFAVGLAIEKRFQPGVFLLDDGFQHWRLDRALDIVCIDALDPFAGGPIPLGRLRERPGALRRAGAIVVTRCPVPCPALEREIRRHTAAPIFRSWVVPAGFVDPASGELRRELPPGRIGAFCGLGNPDSFWMSLRELGISPVFRRAFGDHHAYSESELRELAASADVLITTEKDAANLPAGTRKVYWLQIGIEIDRGAELLELVAQASTCRR